MKRDEDGTSQHPELPPMGSAESRRREAHLFDEEITALLHEAEPVNPYSALAAAWDQRAVEDERFFSWRFGFDWPRRDRIALIELKHKRDVTDREIRFLKRTGNLKRKNGTVALTATRGSAIYGRCLIVGIFVEYVLMVLPGMLTVHHLSALQAAKFCTAAAYVIAMAWSVNLGFVKPWTIQRRVLSDGVRYSNM
ncbi:MAG: hypothetical protein J0H27_08770 [Xanthomonadales bacterium]|nr:hypothetical protein [Xanthomonadales bacterium]OJY83784.1 MAG: hypothetical protein BGP23_14240 [Xanthomonadales bacterium 66-474]